jgi:hypothetical protein
MRDVSLGLPEGNAANQPSSRDRSGALPGAADRRSQRRERACLCVPMILVATVVALLVGEVPSSSGAS